MDISFFMRTLMQKNYIGSAAKLCALRIEREKTLSSSTQTRAEEGGRVRKR